MEGGEENFNGTLIPKKSRPLDLKGLYKSQLRKETPKKKGLKKDYSSIGSDDKKMNKRKKVRMQVSLSRSDNADGGIKKTSDEELSSGRHDSQELKFGLSQRLRSKSELGVVLLSFRDNGVHIPTQKRSERKKIEDCEATNQEGLLSCETRSGDQVPKLGKDNLLKGIDSSKIKQKNSDKFKENKEKRSSGSNSIQRFKENGDLSSHPLVNSGGSLKKLPRIDRKRKTLASDRVSVAKESEPLIEDDGENLEENAARMLSSMLLSTNDLSFLQHSSQNIVNLESKSRPDSESAPIDTASRNMKQRKEYIDISLGDVDAHWVLNRRIKVFWPLDHSWYYGYVHDYNEEQRLYHIKYDDRDEEWVDLQSERFKLQLLRSEIPRNPRASNKSTSSDQQNGSKSRKERERRKAITGDDSYGGSDIKSSSFQGNKKQKTSATPPSSNASLLLYDESVRVEGHLAKGSLGDVKNNLSCDPISQDKSPLQRATCTKDRKPHIVYFRKRYRRATPIFEVEGPLCFTYKARVSKIFWDMDSAAFTFDLNFPIRSVLNCSFESESLWLLGVVLLRNYGTLVTKWPRVSLTMIFVDNVVGLRFLVFEGCLNMVVAFIFLVLRVFHQPAPQENFVHLRWPFTSIGFKFSSVHVIKKPLVFAFYSFFKVKSSKWKYLDSKLKRYCVLCKQLPLSECTYDNILALQNGSSEFPITSTNDPTLVKLLNEQVSQKRRRPWIYIMGGSKVSTQVDTRKSLDANERKFPPFALSFAAAPSCFLTLHLNFLMMKSATGISFCDPAPIDDQEESVLVENDCSNINLKKDTMSFSKGATGTSISHGSARHRNRNSSLSSHGNVNSFFNDFSVGPRKPRRRVSSFVVYEYNSKHKKTHHQNVASVQEKNFESLSCDANVLITVGDKGWRQCGAQVVLELLDHNEWKLGVKLLGITRYSYKANQFLQPGSRNRYTNAMMWKKGNDWTLEFPDRRQWTIFKAMHEECYNRNIRAAASVKNIPIPGVHLIQENDDDDDDNDAPEIAYFRSCNYFRQVQTDIEMALDPFRVMYDMDSDDEQWISNIQNSEKDKSEVNVNVNVISEDMFEKTMDLFEKEAYTQQRHQFTPNEIEALMVDVGPLCIVKIIYDYWQRKRQKKGMALIRHFQPPLWKRYEQQVKEWEVSFSKNNTPSSNGCLDKVATLEKPPMFAFCLKPRGLELLNKGLKNRSQKRVSLSGHTNSNLYQDGFHSFGRRVNGFAYGDEKFIDPGHSYDCLDDSSPNVFSPQDAGKLNGPQRNGSEQLDSSKLDEFKLRNATIAAQNAVNIAKFKRQRAHVMQNRAYVMIHRAAVALITAEAMKASEDSVEGDAEPQEGSK